MDESNLQYDYKSIAVYGTVEIMSLWIGSLKVYTIFCFLYRKRVVRWLSWNRKEPGSRLTWLQDWSWPWLWYRGTFWDYNSWNLNICFVEDFFWATFKKKRSFTGTQDKSGFYHVISHSSLVTILRDYPLSLNNSNHKDPYHARTLL